MTRCDVKKCDRNYLVSVGESGKADLCLYHFQQYLKDQAKLIQKLRRI